VLRLAASRLLLPLALALVLVLTGLDAAFAHALAEGDNGYIKEITGVNLLTTWAPSSAGSATSPTQRRRR